MQTSSITVMATGMVLIIVMRQIDLSVGSMLGIVAVSHRRACRSIELGPMLGVGHPAIWIIAVVFAIVHGRGHRLLQRHPDRLRPDPVLHRHAGRPHRL